MRPADFNERDNMTLLKDDVVLVTGGGSGLGAGVARHFLTQGAQLAIMDISGEKLDAHRAEFGDRNGAEQRIQSTRNPNAEKEPDIRQVSGDFAGRAKDARANRVPDDHGKTKADAEYF